MKQKQVVLFILLFVAGISFSELRPSGIFTDRMVLQQQEPVRIWGAAAPNETVTVSFAGQTLRTEADEQGNWGVTLRKMKENSKNRSLMIRRSKTKKPIKLHTVLVGEVWLAGGQSNMQSTMGFYRKTTQSDIDQAHDPLLRMTTLPKRESAGQNNLTPQWEETTPENVRRFSAAAYYFAKDLRAALDVPIGIISCSVGGTPIEAWMSRKTLESQSDFFPCK